jgi:hypothetical protein
LDMLVKATEDLVISVGKDHGAKDEAHN